MWNKVTTDDGDKVKIKITDLQDNHPEQYYAHTHNVTHTDYIKHAKY